MKSPLAAEMADFRVSKKHCFLRSGQKYALSGIKGPDPSKPCQNQRHENDHPWLPWIQESGLPTFCVQKGCIFVNTGPWD